MPFALTRTTTVGIAAAHVPTAEMLRNGRLRLNLGSDIVEVGLGNNPRVNLEALRDALSAVLNESETSHG